MFRLTFLLLSLFSSCLISATPLNHKEIPDPLEPWVDWVLLDNKNISCPFAYNNGKHHRCAWPTRLEMSLQESTGSFSIIWHVYQKSWIALPGSQKNWPVSVTDNGNLVSLTKHNGQPALLLEPGSHELRGNFEWTRLPDAIQIPKDTGLISLNVNQKLINFPNIENGRIWIKQRQTDSDKGVQEQLKLEVYRHILDDLPLQMTTRIELQVSGKQREMIIGKPLLADTIPLQLNSPLPARLEADGSLRVQLRPGRWNLEIVSRFPDQTNKLMLIDQTKPWPKAEVWVFQAQNNLRLVEIESGVSIDPRQTKIPKKWRQLPAYRLQQGESFSLKTIRRGDPEPEPNTLKLHRQLWLDQSGNGYTIKDEINGRMTSGWRLNANDSFELGRVILDNDPQFITQLDTKKGVEVRRGQVHMSADSRYQGDVTKLNAVGWDHDFQGVTAMLHLPPGWKLFSASGVDTVNQTWLHKWTLLDLFLVLIISIAIARLCTWSSGLISLLALVLFWHEPSAPQFIWLHIIAAIALLRVLPANKFRWWVSAYRNLALLVLVVISVPFMINEVRIGLYPQLEFSRMAGYFVRNAHRDALPTSTQSSAMITADKTIREVQDLAGGSLPKVASAPKEELHSISKRLLSNQSKFEQRYDAKTQVQTGPGLPSWQWYSVPLKWNGPVEKNQQLELTLLSPKVNLFLNMLRVLLLIALTLIISKDLRSQLPPSGRQKNNPTPKPIAAMIVLPLLLALQPQDSHAEFPSPKLLNELKTRLLAAPECLPECAQTTRLNIDLKPESLHLRLEIHTVDDVMVPLPGSAGNWLPSQIAVNGAPAEGLAKQPNGQLWIHLNKGIHQLLLFGPLPDQNSIDLDLPLHPFKTNVQAEGWEVAGIHDEGIADQQLKLSRLESQKNRQKDKLENVTLPPFVRIHRTLRLGLDWRVETRIERASPIGTAVVLQIPLLEGESILSDGFRVKDKHVLINLSARDSSVQWESSLKISQLIKLHAAQTNEWVEIWTADVSPIWHMHAEGIAVVHHQNPNGQWLPEWRPWPGESVQLNISRPEGVAGQTLTIDRSKLNIKPGLRATDANLHFSARSSQGGQHTITLPSDARLQSVMINGRSQPIRQGDQGDERKVTLPLIPGQQNIQLHWLQAQGIANFFTSPEIDLGIASVNNLTNMNLGRDRWVLFIGGPEWGPAVLFWGVLIVLLLVAIGLGRVGLTPLKTWQWMLLLIGLSQAPIYSAIIVIAWLLALAAREKVGLESSKFKFNLSQIALALLTLIAMSALFDAIQGGLLGSPDMQISGNNSHATNLNWFQDRIGNIPPQAWIFSLPLIVYRVLMLLWSLWLAFALIGWLRWGWECFSKHGLWKSFQVRKVTLK